MGGEKRQEVKSLRNGVHHANAVVWGPVRGERTWFTALDDGERSIGPGLSRSGGVVDLGEPGGDDARAADAASRSGLIAREGSLSASHCFSLCLIGIARAVAARRSESIGGSAFGSRESRIEIARRPRTRRRDRSVVRGRGREGTTPAAATERTRATPRGGEGRFRARGRRRGGGAGKNVGGGRENWLSRARDVSCFRAPAPSISVTGNAKNVLKWAL